jgi:parallel beta-helix repeat protein
LSRRCFDNIIQNNVSFDNRLHGIMLDRESNNNLVRNNTVYGNVDGFALYNSKENVFLENEAKNNVRGLRLNEDSSENYFTKNTIVQNSRGVYIYDRSQKNMLVENQVKGSDIGITIRNASFNELYGNFQPLDNKRDGRITEDALENNIQ